MSLPNPVVPRLIASAALALPFLLAPAWAQADEAQCLKAHEQSQVLRMSAKLVEARDQMRRCSDEDCPSVIRKDCARWLDEIAREMPTIVLEAVSEEGAESDVKVYANDKLLTDKLDGIAIEMNPGAYEFRFELEGEEPKTQRVILKQGEQYRQIGADFRPPPDPNAPRPGQPWRPPPPPPPVPTHRPVQTITYVLLGTTVLGGAGFAVFGSLGNSKKDELEKGADSGGCKPLCTDDDLAPVRTNYLIADISLGVGVASAVGALVTYLARPAVPLKQDKKGKEKPPSEPKTGLKLRQFDIAATGSTTGVRIGGEF